MRVKSLDISVPVISSVLGSRALVSAAMPYLAEKLEKHVFALQSPCTPLHLGQMALNLLLYSQLFGG